jgi:predicted Zn-dependent protease
MRSTRWIDSLTATVAIGALFGATMFAAPAQAATHSTSRPLTEAQRIADSGYSGWRLKWANVNQIGRRNLCGGLDFYSLNRQIAMGRQVARQVLDSARLVKDPVIAAYINKVGQNIARNSDARVPYTFRVIDSGVVNAFSLPGGYVFIYSGLILRANNEAELAAVMGHEIAHVAACHGAKQASKGDLAQLAMIPLSVMLPYGWAGYGIYQAVNAAIPLAFLKFSREDEQQADYLGLEYMYKAGYDPNAFVTFFEKIEAQELHQPNSPSTLFSDHPGTNSRIAAVQKEISTILPPRPEYLVDTSRFDSVKHRLELYESGRAVRLPQSGPSIQRNTQSSGQPSSNDKPPVLKRHNFNTRSG